MLGTSDVSYSVAAPVVGDGGCSGQRNSISSGINTRTDGRVDDVTVSVRGVAAVDVVSLIGDSGDVVIGDVPVGATSNGSGTVVTDEPFPS
jgi:hypothetical protein